MLWHVCRGDHPGAVVSPAALAEFSDHFVLPAL